MSEYEIRDLVRYLHNVKRKDGSANPIIGEDELGVVAILSYLLEDSNFVIKAYSGTGKTVIMDAVFGLIPEDYYHTIEHLSETAVWYEEDRINRARFIAIPEAQKLPEGVMEIIKTWGDGRAAFRKKTDVTVQDVVEQKLLPKYVFMCVAIENAKGMTYFDAELERRCMIGHTNPTVVQTERVIKHKLDNIALPKNYYSTMSDEEIEGLRKHLINVIGERDDDASVVIRNPCAPFILEAIPTVFPVSRSKVEYLLRVINAVGRFYPEEILKVEKDGVTYGLLTPKHTWLGLRIYLNSFMNECLHMPSHGTDLLKLFPDTRIDKFGLAGSEVVKMTSREIRTAAKSAGLPFTKLDSIIAALVMTGFLEQTEEDGKKMYFKSPLLREPASKINWAKLISETKVFMKKHWPEIADEYIERNCGEVKILDPFGGGEIEITASSSSAADVKVVKGDFPDIFKYEEDYILAKSLAKDIFNVEFLLTAQGDYGKEEIEAIKSWKHGKKSR
jgi:hypothetical protein